MIKECPDVYFEITPTVSIMNVYHLPDFHKEWIDKGLLEPQNVRMNILTYPTEYRIQIIPPKERKKFIDKYTEHIKWIDDNFGDGSLLCNENTYDWSVCFQLQVKEKSTICF